VRSWLKVTAILEDLGVAVPVGSLTTEVVRGMAGTEVQPDAYTNCLLRDRV
jgi:hypothetical protein